MREVHKESWRIPISVTLSRDVLTMLDEYAAEFACSRSQAVERLVLESWHKLNIAEVMHNAD